MTKNGKKIHKYFSKGISMNRISDEEFDQLLNRSLQQIFPHALKQLSLDEQDIFKQSVWIKSPPKRELLEGLTFQFKKGKDKVIRFIPIGITIYHFGHHSMLAYQCTFDPTTESAMHEQTFEFFYNDIVSFETRTESDTARALSKTERALKKIPGVDSIFTLGKEIQYDKNLQFILTTSGGTQLAVGLTDHVISQKVEGGKFSLEGALRSVNTVRRTIRDKKSHTFARMTEN